MRLIDADKLIDIITNSADLGGVWGQVLRAVKDAFIRLIRTMPNVNPEPKWTLCSERLPEKNGRYLVTRGLKACNSIWNRVYIINYSDLMGLKAGKIWWNGNVGKSDFQRIDDVVAWRYLPEPWKG